MSFLIVSLLAISCVAGSFGVIYPIPQSILPYSTLQPAEYQFNSPAGQFSPSSGQFSPPAGQFNQPAGQLNQPTGQFNPQAGQFNPSAGQFNPQAGQFNPPAVPFNPPAGQFKPPARQLNQPTGQFTPQAGQFNPSAGKFNPPAEQYNPPAVKFPSPVIPKFNSYEIPNPLQASASVTAPSPSSKGARGSKFNDVVSAFGHQFIKTLLPSPKYTDAFNLQNLSKEKAVGIYYDRVRDESARAGEKDPEFSGYSASRGVKDNYDAVNSTYHMKVYGFALGEFLYQRGVLTADNAIELSDRLSQIMRDTIDANANPSSEDNLIAIIRGCEKYLTDLNSFGADASYAVVSIFSGMWYLLRGCF